MNYVFESPDIKNVAISGAYGAGKSSLLASYKKRHSEKNYIHISLAHFKNENTEENEISETVLEGKILNQLIHQISPKNIPQTNFKVKQNTTKQNIIFSSAIVLFYLIAIMFIVFFSSWKKYVFSLSGLLWKIFSITLNQWAIPVAGISIWILSFYFIYCLMKLQKNKNLFKKLNFQGNEIEIFEDKDESYFDKYLNEVLYLFENSNADVIVFEDMDRFELNHIFERLREINSLVNIQLQKRKTCKILRFFYLLRDDVFISKDRTKFFDYIIPVVPVVDGTNSYDKFIGHFKRNNLLKNFDEQFLQGISLYIDDMRLLKNICNEFLIYYNRLNITELDYNKMFAIITYKNLFPKDFSELQMGRGYVFSLFSHKDIFIENEKRQLEEKIEEKNNEINILDNEVLESEQELELIRKKHQDAYTSVSNYSPQRTIKKEEYDAWFNGIYQIRKNAIGDKKASRLSMLNSDIANLKLNISKLQSCSLHELITRDNSDEIFRVVDVNEIGVKQEFLEIRGNEYFDLLKYLIRNGYIDETYADYMTYFYENSLNRIDKIFLRSIRDKKAKEYSYSLKNCKLIMKYLNIYDFEQIEILNFDLFSFLIKDKQYSEYLKQFVYQLKRQKNYDFICRYFSYNSNMDEYVCLLNKYWPELFKELYEECISEIQIRQYAISTLLNCNDETIKNVNIDNCLTNYVSASSDFLNLQNINISRCIHVFKMIDVCFSEINYEIANEELFIEVYKNSLYAFNYKNISMMLRIIAKASYNDIEHKNYSLILYLKDSPLYLYVQNNMEEYVKINVNHCNSEIYDEENAAMHLINHEDVEFELKKMYLEVFCGKITDIEQVNHELWNVVFALDKVHYNEKNIYSYFKVHETFDDTIINFINCFNEKINMSEVEIDNDKIEKFFSSCVCACDIDNMKYHEILSSMQLTYRKDFQLENVTFEKMKILIDDKIIRMSTTILKFMRTKYSDSCLYFIKQNIQEFIQIMNSDIFLHEELLEILTWDIDDSIKLKLLVFSSKEISIIDTNYSVDICIYILNNNFNKNDLPELYSNYDTLDSKVQEFVFVYASSNMEETKKLSGYISSSLATRLLSDVNITKNSRIELFILLVPYISKELGKIYAESLNCNSYEAMFYPRKKPKYEINDLNTRILNAFREAEWIYEFLEDENRKGYYNIRRNKPVNRKKLDIELL